MNQKSNTSPKAGAIVPFGKYKDQPVELLLADGDYLNWVMSQPGIVAMLQKRHPTIYNIIVTGAPTTEDTPEHNRLQAMFLEPDFQLAFIEAATGKTVRATIESRVAEGNKEAIDRARRSIAQAQKHVEEARAKLEEQQKDYEQEGSKDFRKEYAANQAATYSVKCSFEEWRKKQIGYARDRVQSSEQSLQEKLAILQRANEKLSLAVACEPKIRLTFECGYDIELELEAGAKVWRDEDDYGFWHVAFFKIELKPQMGDDFPSVLRQMKNNGADTLVIGSFNAAGATLEQVRAIFGNKKIITLGEIEKVRQPATSS